jgi:biopolymer transport protein ExbD
VTDPPKRFFDLWFVQANHVIKEVPYHVVTDWIAQGRAVADDQVKPSGTAEWYPLGTVVAFQPYFPKSGHLAEDAYEAMAPVEMDIEWPKGAGVEEEDVDMIPLIDISLVLLIFFMMTTTVAAISRISVPEMTNAVQISESDVLRIDMDWQDGKVVYGLGVGTGAPAAEDDNLSSDVELSQRLDEHLRGMQVRPRVRIAAHGDIPYYLVEEVMKGLDRRQEKGQISEYAVEVNERAKP